MLDSHWLSGISGPVRFYQNKCLPLAYLRFRIGGCTPIQLELLLLSQAAMSILFLLLLPVHRRPNLGLNLGHLVTGHAGSCPQPRGQVSSWLPR